MLLVAKRRRMAFHIAALPLVGSLVFGAAAAHGTASTFDRGLLIAALLAGGMLLYVIGSTRVVRARAHTIVVRSLLDRQTFDARAAAFGVSATYGGRSGATYTVYVTDGMRRSDIASYASRRALGVASKLTGVFAVTRAGGSSEARGLVSREIEAWKAQEDAAMRQVNAYYASRTWKRMPIYVGVGLALYLAAVSVVMYLDK